jgi:nuclear pore complex protein Nup155
VIEDTWESLINAVHYENNQKQQAYRQAQQNPQRGGGPVLEAPGQPYEAVSNAIQQIAHRTSLDSLIFPIDTLLPAVCRYAISGSQDASIGADPAWPVMLFLQLGVSHALVVRVLEQILDAQEVPFTAKRRKVVVQWIDVAVEDWIREIERRGGAGGKGGDAAIGAWVAELLGRAEGVIQHLMQSARGAAENEELGATKRITNGLRRDVEGLVAGAVAQGRLGFAL